MMTLTPALGVPSEEMLQDTLKSLIVSTMSVGAALLLLWQLRDRGTLFVWHQLIWLPLALTGYALGSMLWSHEYLAGVESVRWFVFSLILWLGMNVWKDSNENRLLWGIHWGVTIASIWTAWQFWGNFNLFPQGPNPASTFVNRNFFAEYAICALPYSVCLVLRTRDYRETLSVAALTGFNLCALLMTGTRSALIALVVFIALVPLMVYRCWRQLDASRRGLSANIGVIAVMLGMCVVMGSIPTANPALIQDFGRLSAVERSLNRAASIAAADEYTKGSFSMRSIMWAATGRMVADNPVLGVGAGAWEVEIPRYQTTASMTETDYYAHNEFLQLLAEYGILGWLFLGALLSYLLLAAWKTWSDPSELAEQQAPLRAFALASLLMFLIVSNAGFPWRMASTGALFALSLSLLASSEAMVPSLGTRRLVSAVVGRAAWIRLALAFGAVCLCLCLYIGQRAARAERSLVRSMQLALTISRSSDPRSPVWDSAKADVLRLARDGVSLNSHYRKVTPAIADILASWGDWKNALWIWESVLAARPNVLALITKISRAQLELDNLSAARSHLVRAQRLQPLSPSILALEAEILYREGHTVLAIQRINALFDTGIADYNLALLAYKYGKLSNDTALMARAREWRAKPAQ